MSDRDEEEPTPNERHTMKTKNLSTLLLDYVNACEAAADDAPPGEGPARTPRTKHAAYELADGMVKAWRGPGPDQVAFVIKDEADLVGKLERINAILREDADS